MISQLTMEQAFQRVSEWEWAEKQVREQFVCSQCHVIVSRVDDVCPHCQAKFIGEVAESVY